MKRRGRILGMAAGVGLVALSWALIGAGPSQATPDWPLFGHDAARQSVGASDTTLTPANVGGLRRRWAVTLDDTADSTPILLSHVAMPDGSTRALLFQTTKSGETYAIDARRGTVVWRFRTHGPKITTSTPAADPGGRIVYVPGVDGMVHALAAATGQEVRRPGFPLRLTLMPDVEKDAAALNLANGYLYAATSGYIGDAGPYDGHVVAVRLRDGLTHVFNSLCTDVHHLLLDRSYNSASQYYCADQRSGIWSRGGVVVDPDPAMGGRIYVATGNGLFNPARRDYGDSVLALSADGATLLGSYTPSDYQYLDDADVDLGSTAPVLLPRQAGSATPLLAVQGGKDGLVRLLDRARLGGVGGELQRLSVPGATLFSAPAVWQQAGAGTWVYLGDSSHVTALRLRTDRSGRSRLALAWADNLTATSPVVVNGIVIVAGSGALTALDARSGATLWNSTQPSAGGSIGDIHWESPIAVGGWVYCSDESGRLTAYALPGR